MATRKKKETIVEEIKEEAVIEEKPVKKAAPKKKKIKVTVPRVNVRASANFMAPVLTISNKDTVFDLASNDLVEDFYEIEYENGKAYVSKECCELV